ncbi:MAG: oxidoreductase FAD-binding region, partial [Candidatus Saccharibacteria bacterium]|nr:oxidoreductase FAD-binding region [Candidatus Saccharibacteria bacterium]
ARPYSAASTAHNMPLLELTIQHVPDGEVSSYVNNALEIGDTVEIRGPFGKFFVWDPTIVEPMLLIAGGSGIVPMRSMLESHTASQSSAKMHLVYSARTYENIIYKDELVDSPDTTITLTQNDTEDWQGATGRINALLLQKVLDSYETPPLCYICGMSSFVGAASDILQSLGVLTDKIKTERFG